MTKETFDGERELASIRGMSCSACSARVERAVGKLVGTDNFLEMMTL